MLSAMMIKTKIDTGATSEEQGFYDYMLIMIQFMSPAMLVYVGLMKGREVILKRLRKKRKSKLQAASAPSDVERGVELTVVGGIGGGEGGMVLGGLAGGMQRSSGFDTYKNPNLMGGSNGGGGQAMPRTSKFDVGNPLINPPSNNSNAGKQSVKASSLLKVDSKGNVGPSNAGRPKSSFDTYKNPNLMGGSKGRSKGGSKGGMNKKTITKEAPKRKSMFAIPKEHLEDAPTGPPKIPPPPILEDDDDNGDEIGPPRFPPPPAEASLPSPKPVCQWTEQWSEEYQTVYYLNIDMVTSTWEMPDDFWRDEKR